MEATYDTDTIRLMTFFENATNVGVKDCFVEEESNTAYFIVEEGKAGLAIGKNGANIKRVENLMKKNVKVFEFSADIATFVKRLIPQVLEVTVKNGNGKVEIEIKVDKNDRPVVIGRDGKNLKLYKELLQRNFKVDDLIIK